MSPYETRNYLPVTQGVARSSPVQTAIKIGASKRLNFLRLFLYVNGAHTPVPCEHYQSPSLAMTA